MIDRILSKLSPEEFEEFQKGNSPLTNSRKISGLMRKTEGLISRDEIFKRVFKKKRTLENDHLLRNEISIVKRKLENFIIHQSTTDIPTYTKYFRPYVMAQWCIKRNLVKESEKYIGEALVLAKKGGAYKGLLSINKILFQITQYSKSDYEHKLALLQSVADDHMDYLKEFVAEEVRYADFIRSGAYKLAENLRKTTYSFKHSGSFTHQLSSSRSRLSEFYFYKSQAYRNTGLKAVELLEKALACIDEELEMYNKDEEVLSCMSAAAMEYAMAGEFQKSVVSFEKILVHKGFKYFPAQHSVLFNYCTTLLKVREYEKALKYLEELEKLEMEPIVAERIYTMKCNCYIFMENDKELKKILPTNLQSFDISVRVYYRFLYLIYYLIKKEDEIAERELVNIKKMKDFDRTDYLPLARIFEKYISTMNAIRFNEKDKEKKKRELQSELRIFKDMYSPSSQLLPGMWILEKSQLLLGTKAGS